MESSPKNSLDGRVKQVAQVCNDLQLGTGDLVFWSRKCSQLPFQHAVTCFG